MFKNSNSLKRSGKIRRKSLAVLCLISLVGPAYGSPTDLSPKKWRAGDLEIYNWLDKQFGLQNVLAEGRTA